MHVTLVLVKVLVQSMLKMCSHWLQGNAVVQAPLQVAGKEWLVTCVSMGNPHAVVFGTKDFEVKVNVHHLQGRGDD